MITALFIAAIYLYQVSLKLDSFLVTVEFFTSFYCIIVKLICGLIIIVSDASLNPLQHTHTHLG